MTATGGIPRPVPDPTAPTDPAGVSGIAPASSERLLDTHCHLDAYADPLAVLKAADGAGVDVVAVTEDPGRYRTLCTRLGARRGVTVALGCHPLRAGVLAEHDLARFFRLLPRADWVGEIGLDFSSAGTPTRRRQLAVFDAILAEPVLCARPVTVHSRGAETTVIARLAQARVPAILHWYTGPLAAVDDALAAGAWFSVNLAMTRSRRATALLRLLPPERVLLETDGPYARYAGRSTQPAQLRSVLLTDLALRWGMSASDAAARIRDNQRRLLN